LAVAARTTSAHFLPLASLEAFFESSVLGQVQVLQSQFQFRWAVFYNLFCPFAFPFVFALIKPMRSPDRDSSFD
jgi:hypothetical protein